MWLDMRKAVRAFPAAIRASQESILRVVAVVPRYAFLINAVHVFVFSAVLFVFTDIFYLSFRI
jgi:hypothetical protein